MGLFKKKKVCPKCGSDNLGFVKPSMLKKFNHMAKTAYFPWAKGLKTFNVCKDCDLSWEDR